MFLPGGYVPSAHILSREGSKPGLKVRGKDVRKKLNFDCTNGSIKHVTYQYIEKSGQHQTNFYRVTKN